ncbi:hypothetical protein K3495_g5085 [Podosphaera aphanis]|nr:hypothetical protein K3495_g5085 [Podosphaera aphanis]
MCIAQNSRFTDRFFSNESALSACRTIAVENGYGLRMLGKKTNRQGVITSRQVVCDRLGSGESRSKGIRRSGSIRCDCEFALSIRLSGDEYIIDISNPNHNHPPSVSAYSHPSNTRLSETEKKEVIDKSELGIPPRIILAELRSKGGHATSTAVYNCIAKHRKFQLGDQSPISALLRLLEEKDDSDSGNEDRKWWYDYLVDTDDCLTHLFFQHTTSIALLRQFPEIIIMDFIYSTNGFGMPLLHIDGCTNINTTFEVSYAFLIRETEADYIWALGTLRKILQQNNIPEPGVIATDRELVLMNAIEQEFPLAKNILCFWHIKMAFQSFLGKGLDDDGIKDLTEDFMEVVHPTTVADFSEKWSSCSAKWTVVHPYDQQVVTYLKDTWLPYADCFVYCHTKGHLHLGHLTTRKVEGTHHYVKMFIGDSTGHLFTVVKRIKTALGEQHQRYQDMLHKKQGKGITSGSLYRGVNSLICRHVLKLVEDQKA